MANDEVSALKEEARYFDFASFYKSAEFSDRLIRLEVLDESENDLEAKEDHSTVETSSANWSESLLEPASLDKNDIPVNSILLAAKSSVLKTMLSNGMKESDKSAPVIIRVTHEEKAAFEELLQFLYGGSLSPHLQKPTTDVRELVALILLADKFDVPSLLGAVCKQLHKIDGVQILSRVPPAIWLLPPLKEVIDDATARVVEAFKDVSGKWGSESFSSLSLEVVEVLLQSEDLEADSEEEIFDKVLALIRSNLSSLSLRLSIMTRLCPLIRFSCMSGEYLEGLLSCEELQHKETQALITAALRFQAYSDNKKEKLGQGLCQRKGVHSVHLEILDNFLLDESGTKRQSPRAVWFGKKWYIEVQKDFRGDPPTVGVFLYCEKSASEESQSCATDTVAFKIYVRTWPSGRWKEVFDIKSMTFSLDVKQGKPSWGAPDALQMPWDEARESDKFVGSTGTVTFKIKVRRF